jgi:hypothetical protein
MLSAKKGLSLALILGVSGALVFVGCSASGVSEDLTGFAAPSAPATTDSGGGDNSNKIPTKPVVDGGEDEGTDPGDPPGPVDAGKTDSGVKDASTDAAKDAAPDAAAAPDEGSACATANQIYVRSCGACGKQSAVCIASDAGTGGIVSPYGACRNQVVNGCIPGTTETTSCGNCGTMTRTCNAFCSWSSGACQGQPANSCTPGAFELNDVGCPTENTYRQRSCSMTCSWGNFSDPCEAPPSFVNVPPSVGSVNSTVTVLTSSRVTKLLSSFGTCPLSASGITSKDTPYAYIEVRNPLPKAATVSVYNSKAPGGLSIDTIMAAYEGATIPTTAAERQACKGAVNDTGNSTLTGSSAFASLDGTRAITIPANSSYQIYFAAYYAYDPTDPTESTGLIQLNVKTESIAP